MTEHPSRRGWPAMPARDPVRRRRLFLTVLYVAVAINSLLWALTFAYILVRGSVRDQEQQQINTTFCQVLAQLPADSPELDHIRAQLACKQSGLTPEQLKQLTKTGGTH